MTDLTGARWVKSTRSASNGQCVEVSANLLPEHGTIYVRDSKRPNGPTLPVTARDWTAFLHAAKHGAFDL